MMFVIQDVEFLKSRWLQICSGNKELRFWTGVPMCCLSKCEYLANVIATAIALSLHGVCSLS